jgi:hypothetical protein
VWSERESGGWHDCTFSSVLAVLAAGGFERFPLGAYTDPEREALERAQTIFAPEKGANFPATDQAITNRYGLALHDSTELAGLLARPGLAIAIGGVNARLATRLRHWDPTFAGNHAATVITLAPAGLLWLDPEAPMGYPGDPISAAEVTTWWNKLAVRYLALGELAAVTTITLTPFVPPRPVSFTGPRTYLGYDPASLAQSGRVTIAAAGSGALAAAAGTIVPAPAWAVDGRVLHILNGGLAGKLVALAGIGVGAPPPAPAPDCSAAVGEALTLRDAAWHAALAKVAP